MEENTISYKFEYRNQYGTKYQISKQDVILYTDLGDSERLELAQAINLFMRHIGYFYDKDYVFLESVTEDEYDYLLGALDDYRRDRKD